MNQEAARKVGERSLSPNSSQSQSPVRGQQGQSVVARRRAKRKRNKQRHRAKLKQVREQGMIVFQNIIKDIYALRANYQTVEHVLEDFFLLEANSEVLYDTIDSIMRQEIDLIRRKIVAELNAYPLHADESARDRSAKNVFECIRRIQRGSPEIEKIINLFVRRRFGGDEDDPPLKTNLDLMTLKFLYRNDLQPSEHFAAIVQRIAANEAFKREREIYNAMILAAVRPEDSRDSDWSGYESEDEEGEGEGEGEGGREGEQEQQEQQGEQEPEQQESGQGNRRKKRRGRRRRGKVDLQVSFESILQRTEELEIREQERLECKVEESWIRRMQEQRTQYRRPN